MRTYIERRGLAGSAPIYVYIIHTHNKKICGHVHMSIMTYRNEEKQMCVCFLLGVE
jgi:hypothetical protein